MTETKSRVFGLDILRATAILSVMQAHGYLLVQAQVSAAVFNPLSLDGVSIFFVLSGFLIGRILIDQFESGETNLLRFWTRRWLRTLPAYYFVLGILATIYVSQPFPSQTTLIKLMTFRQNLFHGPPGWFVEAWSLSVEEWFYLTVPLLLLAIKRKPSALPAVIFGVIFASLAFRTVRALNLGLVYEFHGTDWTEQITMPVACRMETIGFGVLAAYLLKHYREKFELIKMPMFGAGAFLILAAPKEMFLTDPVHVAIFMNFGYVTTLGIGAFLMLPLLSSLQTGKGPAAAAVTFISKISYPMYLTNMLLVQLTILPLIAPTKGFVALGIWWSVTIVFSFAVHKCVELPFLKLRDRERWSITSRA